MGLVHNATSHNYPLIMSFSVEENAVFIDEFSKNLPTVGGGTPPPTSLARAWSLRSLAYYRPPPKIKFPGYATADGEMIEEHVGVQRMKCGLTVGKPGLTGDQGLNECVSGMRLPWYWCM